MGRKTIFLDKWKNRQIKKTRFDPLKHNIAAEIIQCLIKYIYCVTKTLNKPVKNILVVSRERDKKETK